MDTMEYNSEVSRINYSVSIRTWKVYFRSPTQECPGSTVDV